MSASAAPMQPAQRSTNFAEASRRITDSTPKEHQPILQHALLSAAAVATQLQRKVVGDIDFECFVETVERLLRSRIPAQRAESQEGVVVSWFEVLASGLRPFRVRLMPAARADNLSRELQQLERAGVATNTAGAIEQLHQLRESGGLLLILDLWELILGTYSEDRGTRYRHVPILATRDTDALMKLYVSALANIESLQHLASGLPAAPWDDESVTADSD